MHQTIGHLLKAARIDAGLTQEELSHRMAREWRRAPNQGSISSIERGLRNPSFKTLEAWTKACGMKWEVVLSPR